MVSASKTTAKVLAALSTAAVWVSIKLSVAAAIGLTLLPFVGWIPPFLAPQSTAAPVAVIRTVPVPYLDIKPPETPTAPPTSFTTRDATAKVLKAVRRATVQEEGKEPPQALGKAETKAADHRKDDDDDDDDDDRKVSPAPQKGAPQSSPQSTAKPAPSADPKSDAGKAKAPEPGTWSDTEIIAALRDCLGRLAPLGAEIELAQPVKEERCGAPAPVVLRRLGTGAGKVELQPPATINCAMVASLHAWVEKTLQPAAQELLGSPIVRMRQVSGYVCRNRIGTPQLADRLSEHALANALDIAGFVTADGRTVDVLGKWGPTVRDLREAQEKAWEAVQAAKGALKQAESEAAQAAGAAARAEKGQKREQAMAAAAQKKAEASRKREEAQAKEADWKKALARTAEMQKLTRGTDAKPGGAGKPVRAQRTADKKGADRGLTPTPPERPSGVDVEALFLRRLHKGACGPFGTVLGPEANEAHRDHFHLDLATRKRSAFCE
jgi:hypothetical protein